MKRGRSSGLCLRQHRIIWIQTPLDAWAHADAEINDESSFDPTFSDENDEIEGFSDLFSTSRTTEDSDAESSGGVLSALLAVDLPPI
jgi:hypothetical protein